MLWIKSLHIIFVVTWFAGLFYLPRLFVYHAETKDDISQARFKVMEQRLLVMTHIGGTLALCFGVWLLMLMQSVTPAYMQQGWLHAKLGLVIALIIYHGWCWHLVRVFANDVNENSSRWYRWFNEIPSILLVGIVLLVVLKPF